MIRNNQLESAWIRNKSTNLSVKAQETTASDMERSAESHDSQNNEASKRKGNSSRSTWQCPCKPPWNPPSIPGNTAALAWF